MKVKAVIMAGGVGKRFWPKSREKNPKQLLPITGDGPMIKNTVNRLKTFIKPADIMIITGESFVKPIRKMVPEIPAANIIGEPAGRNTAPCIGFAAVKIKEKDAVMMMFPSDHVISPVKRFAETLKWATVLAEETDNLITMGIKPSHGLTAYGYIKEGKKFRLKDGGRKTKVKPRGIDAYSVEAFVEKPDEKTAEKYVKDGSYLWNSGIFIWRKSIILDAFKNHLPDVYGKLRRIKGSNIKKLYPTIRKISIDYGIMEKVENRLIIAADFNWNDVGSWEALRRCFPGDKRGNIIQGNALAIDSNDNMIFAEKDLIVTLGVRDLIVVSTDDAVIILKNGRGEEVKKVVNLLKGNRKLNKYL